MKWSSLNLVSCVLWALVAWRMRAVPLIFAVASLNVLLLALSAAASWRAGR